MADKTDFTPDEWKTLLESVMMAGIAVTAADPTGLWGTLKESMASARTVMGAAHDPGTTGLVHALAAEFEMGEGRSTARDGLRTQLSGKRPPEIVAKSLEVLKQTPPLSVQSPRRMQLPSKAGSRISARPLLRPRPKGVFSGLAALKSVMPKRRRLRISRKLLPLRANRSLGGVPTAPHRRESYTKAPKLGACGAVSDAAAAIRPAPAYVQTQQLALVRTARMGQIFA
jgi:hypothetical protein